MCQGDDDKGEGDGAVEAREEEKCPTMGSCHNNPKTRTPTPRVRHLLGTAATVSSR